MDNTPVLCKTVIAALRSLASGIPFVRQEGHYNDYTYPYFTGDVYCCADFLHDECH